MPIMLKCPDGRWVKKRLYLMSSDQYYWWSKREKGWMPVNRDGTTPDRYFSEWRHRSLWKMQDENQEQD